MTSVTNPPDTLRNLIKDIRFAMMTTIRPDGSLQSRPMTTQANDGQDDTLWFFSGRSAHAAADIAARPHVNLSYGDPSSQRFVSISGRAEVIDDPVELRARWRPEYSEWFPQGISDPSIVLLKVTIERADYWPSASTWVGRTLAFAKSLVTGQEPIPAAPRPVTLQPIGAGRIARVNWTVLLWAIGVPIPLVLLVALFRGCG